MELAWLKSTVAAMNTHNQTRYPEAAALICRAAAMLKPSSLASLGSLAAEARRYLYARLMNEGERLVSIAAAAKRNCSEPLLMLITAVAAEVVEPRSALQDFMERLPTAHAQPTSEQATGNIRIGFDTLGINGCADARGNGMLWPPLTDQRTGVAAAMKWLNLDLVALPAAWIRPSTSAAWQTTLFIEARWPGGTSFASTAWVGRHDKRESITPLKNMDSNRRFWINMNGAASVELSSACASLPPDHKTRESNAAWMSEMAGLCKDLTTLADRPQGLTRIVVLGDWNMQPPSLGGPGPGLALA